MTILYFLLRDEMSIKIIDLYSGNKFDPAAIVADGYTGVIFKAGQGGWADVPRYHPDWWKMAADFGLYRGWYWLSDSRYHSSVHIREMNTFKIFEDVGELGLWVDVEKPMIAMTEAAYWKTPYAGYKNVVDFVYLIRERGIVPGIYTGPGAYELIMRGAPKTAHNYLGEHDLWTAQYPYVFLPGISKPKLYGSWSNWEWWQYREGPDINLFNGTYNEFTTKYGEGVVIPPAPTEPPIEIITTGETMKGTAKAITNIKPMAGGVAIAQLQVKDYAYGTVGSTDLMNFDHYYKADGRRIELGKLCKAILSNLTITNESEVVIPPPPVTGEAEFDKAILLNTKTGKATEFKLTEV